MKRRFIMRAFALILLPVALGCGGGDSSYKDRQGDVDPETIELKPPPDMKERPGS
ncbi:MAG: hypothetical protein R6U98_36380 [Pirellulaceae bacterium]